jgi:outer membrane protein assembly factor BamB
MARAKRPAPFFLFFNGTLGALRMMRTLHFTLFLLSTCAALLSMGCGVEPVDPADTSECTTIGPNGELVPCEDGSGNDVQEPVDTFVADPGTVDVAEEDKGSTTQDTAPPPDTGPKPDNVVQPSVLNINLTIADDILSGDYNVNASVTGGGAVMGVEFQLDGFPILTDFIPPYTANIKTTDYEDGPHVVTAYTADNFGNLANDSDEVLFDNSPPEIVSLTPSENSSLFLEDEQINVKTEINEPGVLSSVTIKISGFTIGEFTSGPFEASKPFSDLFITEEDLPDDLLVHVIAEDSMGHITEMKYPLWVHSRKRWSYETANEIWNSARALPDGNIVFGNENGTLYCISPDGNVQWSAGLSSAISFDLDVDENGNIYVIDNNGNVYSYNSGGGQRWSNQPQNSAPGGGVTFFNNEVYVPSFNGTISILNADNGGTNWSTNIGSNLSATPTVSSEGTIYIGGLNGMIFAILPGGAIDWSIQTEHEIRAQASIGVSDNIYIGNDGGYVYGIKKNGTQIWKEDVDGAVWGKILVGEDNSVYAAAITSKYLRKINAWTGQIMWSTKLGPMVQSSPVIDENGLVYIGSSDGNLYGVESESGDIVLTYNIGSIIYATPLVLDQKIYVGSQDTYFYSLWAPGSYIEPPETTEE